MWQIIDKGFGTVLLYEMLMDQETTYDVIFHGVPQHKDDAIYELLRRRATDAVAAHIVETACGCGDISLECFFMR